MTFQTLSSSGAALSLRLSADHLDRHGGGPSSQQMVALRVATAASIRFRSALVLLDAPVAMHEKRNLMKELVFTVCHELQCSKEQHDHALKLAMGKEQIL